MKNIKFRCQCGGFSWKQVGTFLCCVYTQPYKVTWALETIKQLKQSRPPYITKDVVTVAYYADIADVAWSTPSHIIRLCSVQQILQNNSWVSGKDFASVCYWQEEACRMFGDATFWHLSNVYIHKLWADSIADLVCTWFTDPCCRMIVKIS